MALFALLVLAFPNLGVAMRRTRAQVSVTNSRRPEKFAQRFCLSSDAHLVCDDHSTINVYSAFYNRRKDTSCGPLPEVTDETPKSCDANFTSEILPSCNGKRECSLPPSLHPHCSAQPFRHSRIVWFCKPDANAPTGDFHLEEEEEEEEILGDDIEDQRGHDELPTLPPATTTTVEIETVATGKKVGKSRVMFCTSKPVKLTCPDGYGIDLYSAFYNTRSRSTCQAHQSSACDEDASVPTCSCGSNATDLVLDNCKRGVSACTLMPESHRFCKDMPFTFMRVVWDCVQGLQRSRVVQSESVSK